MSAPACTCTHKVTTHHGHDRTCPKGLTQWLSWHRTKLRKASYAEIEHLRPENRRLRARVAELEFLLGEDGR